MKWFSLKMSEIQSFEIVLQMFFCDFIECFELKYFFLLLSGVLRRIYSHSSRIQPVAGRE